VIRSSLLVPLLVVLLLPVAAPARGHEYWLAPSRYRASAGDSLRVEALVGTGFRGEARPYAARRALRFLARGPGLVDLTRAAENGALTWGRWPAADDRGTAVAYASDFVGIELPAEEFEAYLKLEGLDGVSRERARTGASARPGRERYRRVCRTWIAGTSPGEESTRRATASFGLPLEIVPVSVPGEGDRLALEVLFDGKPLAGALVRAWRQPLAAAAGAIPRSVAARDSTGPSAVGRTDGRGRVMRWLHDPGEWLVSTVHMVRSQDAEAADWESTWASLTFATLPR
jgi:uncharacterized GH25 family protein